MQIRITPLSFEQAQRWMLQMFLNRTILIAVLLGSALTAVHAQSKDKWQRVYTGEGSIIDMNVSSSALEPEHVLRVDFRTTLSKPENIGGTQREKYKSRIETIRFKLNEDRYRLCETSWFDAKGMKLNSYAPTAEDWRVMKNGGVMEKLFNSVRTLPPFGSWKVVAFRFADGSQSLSPVPELEKLIGTRVGLQANRAEVGTKRCSSLAYEDHRSSKEEFNREVGVRFEAIGINTEYAETTKLRCEGGGWTPPQSLLIRVKEREMLMLWSGVFLVLEREREWTGDIFPPLKRGRG